MISGNDRQLNGYYVSLASLVPVVYSIMLKITKRLKSTLHGRSFDAVVVGGGHNGLVAVSQQSLQFKS